MRKYYFLKLMQVSLMCCLMLVTTGCEDILGKWERPVPSTVIEEAKVLGEALQTGAIVAISYTVGGTEYTATFQKNADDTYTLLSNEQKSSATRAMTRTWSGVGGIVPTGDISIIGNKIRLMAEGAKLMFSVKDTNGASLFETQINVTDGETSTVNTNAFGIDCAISSISVNSKPKTIGNPLLSTVVIKLESPEVRYVVKFDIGDTWKDVVNRYKNNELVKFSKRDGYISVKFSKQFVINMFKGSDSEQDAEAYYNECFSKPFWVTNGGIYIMATDRVDKKADYLLKEDEPKIVVNIEDPEVGQLIGDDGKNYAPASLPDGVHAIAMIACDGSTEHETYQKGLAIALADIEAGNWYTAMSFYKDKLPIFENSTGWMLPSLNQWRNMFFDNGGISDDFKGLDNALKTAGGEKSKLVVKPYWTSTEDEGNTNNAMSVYFGKTNVVGYWGYEKTRIDVRTRACFAF